MIESFESESDKLNKKLFKFNYCMQMSYSEGHVVSTQNTRNFELQIGRNAFDPLNSQDSRHFRSFVKFVRSSAAPRNGSPHGH